MGTKPAQWVGVGEEGTTESAFIAKGEKAQGESQD